MAVLAENHRFLRYLAGFFLYGFSGLLYAEQAKGFFKDLQFGYLEIQLISEVVPSVAQFLTTGLWGRFFDRTTPNRAWVPIRIGWGLDPLLLLLAAAADTHWHLHGLAISGFIVARLFRGAVMGGYWVLVWQIGVTHFAPPGGDTSRYMGLMTFTIGLMRLSAGLVGSWLVYRYGSAAVFLIGGIGVILSGLYSIVLARRDRDLPHMSTIADFESQYAPEPDLSDEKHGRR